MDDVATVPRTQLEVMVEKCTMTPHQKSQVWEIRRKSKNRLAAAKCRKRKLGNVEYFSVRKNFDLSILVRPLRYFLKLIIPGRANRVHAYGFHMFADLLVSKSNLG